MAIHGRVTSPPWAGPPRRCPVVVVAGPTASGKSALALAVAEAFDGTIINGDALQIYRDLRILTARPTVAETARVPHRLYGVLPADRSGGAGNWRDLAIGEIRAAVGAARLPIVVGGTGLYLQALVRGLAPIPPIPRQVRTRVARRLDEVGPEALHRDLARRDPEGASHLAPTDRQRISRAMEILEHTGRSQTDWHRNGPGGAPPDMVFATILLDPPREALFADCDARFARMIDDGALDEVRSLVARGIAHDWAIAKAVGVPPLRRYLTGDISLSEAIRLGQRDTRRYAKRQTTWFRNQMLPDLVLKSKFSESLKDKIFPFISNFLLTGRP